MKKLKKWQIVLIVILALGVIGALAGRGDTGVAGVWCDGGCVVFFGVVFLCLICWLCL